MDSRREAGAQRPRRFARESAGDWGGKRHLPGAEAMGSTSELLPPRDAPGGGMRQVPRLKKSRGGAATAGWSGLVNSATRPRSSIG